MYLCEKNISRGVCSVNPFPFIISLFKYLYNFVIYQLRLNPKS